MEKPLRDKVAQHDLDSTVSRAYLGVLRTMLRSLLVGFVGLACLSGCGGSDKYVPVSGKVIIDGDPVEGCSVTFTPISGAVDDKDAPFGSYAHTDKDGRFTLKVIDPDNSIEGAAVGNHRVYLSTGDDTDQIDPRTGALRGERVPKQYREDEGFKFEVPEGGTTEANFTFDGIKPK
jgi:hypothetical protein